MSRPTDISIIILMISAIAMLALEAIGYQRARQGIIEKPHIRMVAMSALVMTGLLIALNVLAMTQMGRQPLQFIDEIASLFLVINTIIAALLNRISLPKNQNGEFYFLLLSSLTMSITHVTSSLLVTKTISATAWLIIMATLSIKSTEGGKKAEIGLKLAFGIMLFFVLSFIAISLFNHANLPLDLAAFTNKTLLSAPLLPVGFIILVLASLTISGIPPFHFGRIDSVDGGDVSIAYLEVANASILGGVFLVNLRTAFVTNNPNLDKATEFLSIFVIVGFMLLWMRALDQSKIRRCLAYIALSLAPLFSLSLLFGVTVLLPQIVFIIAMFSFVSLTLVALFGSLAFMAPLHLPWQTWEEMSGFGRHSSLPTLPFIVAIASIAGLPGTLGYFIKLSLIGPFKDSLIVSGAIFLSIVVGAACVMRIFVFLYAKPGVLHDVIDERPPASIILAALILIALGFFPFVG